MALSTRKLAVSLAAGALLALLTLAAARPAHAAAASPCKAWGKATPDELRTGQARKAVLCLINLERAVHGRSRLKRSKPLQKAAQKHTAVMVETGCLAHRCGDEPELPERVERSGYLEGADAWQFAESTGCGASAQAMVDNWMASKFHRINILEKTYMDVGVGVLQQPVDERCDTSYATFAVVFGWRTPAPEPSPAS